MKKIFCLCVFVILMIVACSTNANAPTQAVLTPDTLTPDPVLSIPTMTPSKNEYPALSQMVFNDEFDGSALNLNKWTTEYTWGRKNPPELQYYSPTAFSFKNGALRIAAQQETIDDKNYSSGVITTFNSFQFTYGYVEVRVRVPSGQGLWPAIWMLDYANDSHEIDIMEILGHQPDTVYMTLHYPITPEKSNDIGGSYTGVDFSTDFHVFAVDWSPQLIIWYVDGVERFRMSQYIPSAPMYLLANLAVGGDWPGSPDENTKFPAYYDIDYIRVFQNK